MADEQADEPVEPAKKQRSHPRQKPPGKKRSLAWRITRVVLIVLAIPVVLLAVAIGYLHTDAGKERVRAKVEERIAQRVNGSVTIDSLDYALWGDIEVKGVHVLDEQGREAIAVDRLFVRPAWGDLVSGTAIGIDELELTGLHVTILKNADGSSNLKTLFKKREQESESKPSTRPIELRKIAISDVDVVIQNADGTEIAVRDLAISGKARGVIANKDLSVDLDPITLGFDLKKPADQGGLTVGVKNLKTGLAVELTGGKGRAHLKPLSADLSLVVPGKIDRSFPIGFDGISVDLGETGEEGERDLGLSLEQLALGAVSLASIEVKATAQDGKPTGEATADVVGLHVDAPQVNALLGKEVLKSSVDLEAHLRGSAEAPQIDALVKTDGGSVKLAARLDLADKANPRHDVRIEARDVDTDRLLAPGLGVAQVKVASLDLQAKGQGKDAASIATAAEVHARGVVARGVLVDSIDAKAEVAGSRITIQSADVHALEQHLVARGTIDRTSKAVDLALGLSGDVGVAIAKAKEAGLPVTTNLPPGYVRLTEGDLQLTVKGKLDGALTVEAHAEKLELVGGKGKLDAKVDLLRGDPAKGEKSVTLKHFDVALDLDGLFLSSLLAMRGKPIPPALGVDAAIGLKLRGTGSLTDPLIDLTANVWGIRKDQGPRANAVLTAHVTKADARVDLKVADAVKPSEVLLALHADLPLLLTAEKKGLDPARALAVSLELPKRDLKSIAAYVPPLLVTGFTGGNPLPAGHLVASLHLNGSVGRPTADGHIEIEGAFLDPGLGQPRQELELDFKLEPPTASKPGFTLVADVDAKLIDHLQPIVDGHIVAVFPYSPLLAGGAAAVKYDAHFDVGIDSVAAIPPTPFIKSLERMRRLGGAIDGTIDVQGNIQDLTAQVKLEAKGLLPHSGVSAETSAASLFPFVPGPLDVHVAIDVGADKTDVSLKADLDKKPLASLAGTVGLAGKGIHPRRKLPGGLDPSLDLELKIPERTIASLEALRPHLKTAPGKFAGSIKVTGRAKHPLASGGLSVTDVPMVDGSIGGAAVELTLDDKELHAAVGLGGDKPAGAPVTLDVRAERTTLFGFLSKPKEEKGKPPPSRVVALDVKASASKVDIRRLIPKDSIKGTNLEPKGELDVTLAARIELDKEKVSKDEDKTVVKSGSVDGTLALKGSVPLPGSKRMYQNIDLAVTAAQSKVKIDRLRLEESDAEVKDRWLTLDGEVALDKLKPALVSVHLKSNKWLIFGAKTIGLADAPRGTLTIDARAHAELDRPVRAATVDIDKLEVLFPDRYDKAHQPEDVHLGDLIVLKKKDDGSYEVPVGKLPVPPPVAEKARLAALASGAPVPPPPPEETGYDIDLHVAPGARLFQSPIDLRTGGALNIAIRPTGRKIRGKLTMTSGELSLGGKMHQLREGSLVFSDQYPDGYVDFWFERKLPPWTLRDVSEASAGQTIKIHSYGPITDRKSVLSGAGSPGALADLLSMHNVGRERLVAGADLPESVTVDFPQYQGVLALSFISVNLPHLLFLDRVAAWSDPFDDTRAYGRIEHYEGERYFADGKGRVRAGKRPAQIGSSEAEIEVDYLIMNDNRMLFGVGATGGSRGGGGPAVVFEWSSKD